jgi:ABC-type nickel/cobalt efflux system permease component RcnA
VFGLDDWIAGLSDGATLAVVIAVGVALGLRHAADPDHLAAVSALVALDPDAGRRAGLLGGVWGLGHATTLFLLGLPIIFHGAFLPTRAERAAESAIGFVIVALAVTLLWRWRRRRGHAHVHAHGEVVHRHAHLHADEETHAHAHPARGRSPLAAYGIGALHGIAGSAGVGVLLLATIASPMLAVAALGLFAACTAVSMAALSAGFGLALGRPPGRVHAAAVPALGAASLAFGVWYVLAAQGLLPAPV